MQRGLVVEDQPRAREWLCQSLAEAMPDLAVDAVGSLAQAYASVRATSPQLALIDLGLPDGSGIELIDRLNREVTDCVCIVTTIYSDDVHLFPALRAGAKGYLLKDQPRSQIVQGLHGILAGEPPLSPVIARRLLRVFGDQSGAAGSQHGLTPREREALALIAKGYKLPDVALQMSVTRNTAAGFIKSVYRKLNVSSRAEATLEAARMGLVRTDL
ncbi:MAG: response regulator transcription factor [Gammaproteobacteria bacterium]|nr:response regulator transcription factor [Gammaproteobacteria bacterium]